MQNAIDRPSGREFFNRSDGFLITQGFVVPKHSIKEHEKVKVEVRLFANLAKLLPPGSQKKRATLTVRKGTTVDELLDRLNLPRKVTNIVMVNGAQGDREAELKEGDVVSVFPPIAGG